MGTEIDTLVRSSLASLLEEIRKPSWRGRRERELVSLFCFGHLAAHCRAHGFLHDLGQIGIEVAVPQIPGQRALTGADSSKHQVCKDIVVWPGRAMTCWGIDGRPSVRPACIIEWKHNERLAYDLEWLSEFSESDANFVGYVVVTTGPPTSRISLSCARIAEGVVQPNWFSDAD